MNRTCRNIYSLWCQYVQAPLTVRARVMVRFLTCPFGAFLKAIPKSAHILDVGCGDGQLLHLLISEKDTNRTGVGIDHDEDKIRHARKAGISGVVFGQQDIRHFPDAHFDAVCIAHVLYLIPVDQWRKLLSECARVLKSGGVLAVMEVVESNTWKSRLAQLQELISVYVTRMTKGKVVEIWAEWIYREQIEKSIGGPIDVLRVDQGYLHPHVMFVGTK